VLEQALQQFVNQSPWDPVPVRRRLAQRMTAAIAPTAWVIDEVGFPKFGRHSVGVAPPIDWRLFLPQSWDADLERRRKAHLPDQVGHRPRWQLALDMLDELGDWELVAPVLLADGADGEVGEFRLGLEQRELADVVQVPGTISASPPTWRPRWWRTRAGGGR
jgi:SRSO17 transposase